MGLASPVFIDDINPLVVREFAKENYQKYHKIWLCTEPADEKRFEKAFDKICRMAGQSVRRAQRVISRDIQVNLKLGLLYSTKEELRREEGSHTENYFPLLHTCVQNPNNQLIRAVNTIKKQTPLVYQELGLLLEKGSLANQGQFSASEMWRRIALYHTLVSSGVYLPMECGMYFPILDEICQSVGPYILPLDDVCYYLDRPETHRRDAEDRLHCEDGPAIRYRSGEKYYHVHGVEVEPYILEHPEQITLAKIERTWNQEVRRVMIDKYGMERWIESCGIYRNKDAYGTLYLIDRQAFTGELPYGVVHVKNSTPEPTGETKSYFLRVPPTMKTAHEGVAWTYGLTEATYNPLQET